MPWAIIISIHMAFVTSSSWSLCILSFQVFTSSISAYIFCRAVCSCQAHRNPHGVAIEEVAFSSKANFPLNRFILLCLFPQPSLLHTTGTINHLPTTNATHFFTATPPVWSLHSQTLPWIAITAILPRTSPHFIQSSPFFLFFSFGLFRPFLPLLSIDCFALVPSHL